MGNFLFNQPIIKSPLFNEKHSELIKEPVIQVLHTYFDSMLEKDIWNEYLNRIPSGDQYVVNRYKRWQDRHSALLGKLLVLKGLKHYMGQAASLENICRSAHGRPFLCNHELDFNISHSGGYVTCAFTDAGRVGIDIEKIRNLELSDFKTILSASEWEAIIKAEDSFDMFFEYWTKKESVIKADGKGLSIPLQNIIIKDNRAAVESNTWFLKEIKIAPTVKCYLASNLAHPEIVINNVESHEL